MDNNRFDDLTRALGTTTSRRQALKLLAAGTLAAFFGSRSDKAATVSASTRTHCDETAKKECERAVKAKYQIDLAGCAGAGQEHSICIREAKRQRDQGMSRCKDQHCTCPSGTTMCGSASAHNLCCEANEECELLAPALGNYSPARCVKRCEECETWDGTTCQPTCGPCDVCVDGQCEPQCSGCETCVDGACVEGCPSCETCEDGACVPTECPPCHTCFNNECLPDCDPGQTCCNDGCCDLGCDENGNCQTCASGVICEDVCCEEGQICCGGGDVPLACVDVSCEDGQTFNPETCQCEGCPSDTTPCGSSCCDACSYCDSQTEQCVPFEGGGVACADPDGDGWQSALCCQEGGGYFGPGDPGTQGSCCLGVNSWGEPTMRCCAEKTPQCCPTACCPEDYTCCPGTAYGCCAPDMVCAELNGSMGCWDPIYL